MRTFEKLKEKWYEDSTSSFTDIIDDALKFAYNLALEDAVKHPIRRIETTIEGDTEIKSYIDKQSILKLKL